MAPPATMIIAWWHWHVGSMIAPAMKSIQSAAPSR